MNKYITLLINILIVVIISGCSNKPADDFTYDPILISSVWWLNQIPGYQIKEKSLKLTFDNINNRISGFTGCNKLTGSFLIRNGKLQISAAAATRYMCPGKNTMEADYLKLLSTTDSLVLENDQLRLFSKSKMILEFARD